MKTFWITLLSLWAGMASAEYLIYEQDTGKIVSHDSTLEVRAWPDGSVMCDRAEGKALVGSTTNDMNVVPTYTNISQIVLVPLEPKDLQAEWENWRMDELKALCKVLLDEINVLRVNAGLAPRTIQQFKNAIKAKLQ